MNKPSRAIAIARTKATGLRLGLSVLVAGAVLTAFAMVAKAQDQKIITAYGYSTFGELKYPADFAHLDYVNPDAPKGGEISIWAEGTFDTFNPYSSKGVGAALASSAYESLMTGTADEVSAKYCFICTTLEYPEDESWVIFHMRTDVKFSDGTPVTAHDVVFSHYLLLEQGLPSYAEAVKALIPTAEALDDYTVKFTFAPDVPKKNLITQAGGVSIWSKAWYEKTGHRLDETSLDMPPGTGAYVLDSYDVGKRIVYKRNPDYWGNNIPFNVGRNNFDQIRVEYFADREAARIHVPPRGIIAAMGDAL
jgi:microcin C transport system substrate-binding protein